MDPRPIWELYVDGLSTRDGSRVVLVIKSPNGEKLGYTLKFRFEASNNQAKYEEL